MKIVFTCLAVLGVVAGCSNSENRITYDGKFFRAKIAKVDKQRDVFQVSVRDVSKSLDGARAAAHHKAVSYCVKNYGSSDIVWINSPEAPTQQLRIVDNTLTFQGTCPQAQ